MTAQRVSPVLKLRAIDDIGSDVAHWELRREGVGYAWYFWPTLDDTVGFARVTHMPVHLHPAEAEQAARGWFASACSDLLVEITAGFTGDRRLEV